MHGHGTVSGCSLSKGKTHIASRQYEDILTLVDDHGEGGQKVQHTVTC